MRERTHLGMAHPFVAITILVSISAGLQSKAESEVDFALKPPTMVVKTFISTVLRPEILRSFSTMTRHQTDLFWTSTLKPRYSLNHFMTGTR